MRSIDEAVQLIYSILNFKGEDRNEATAKEMAKFLLSLPTDNWREAFVSLVREKTNDYTLQYRSGYQKFEAIAKMAVERMVYSQIENKKEPIREMALELVYKVVSVQKLVYKNESEILELRQNKQDLANGLILRENIEPRVLNCIDKDITIRQVRFNDFLTIKEDVKQPTFSNDDIRILSQIGTIQQCLALHDAPRESIEGRLYDRIYKILMDEQLSSLRGVYSGLLPKKETLALKMPKVNKF